MPQVIPTGRIRGYGLPRYSHLEALKPSPAICYDTLWWTNIAIENGPFIDGLPVKNGDFGFDQ